MSDIFSTDRISLPTIPPLLILVMEQRDGKEHPDFITMRKALAKAERWRLRVDRHIHKCDIDYKLTRRNSGNSQSIPLSRMDVIQAERQLREWQVPDFTSGAAISEILEDIFLDDLISRRELVETIERAQDSLISDNDVVHEKNKGYFKGLAWANHLVRTAPTVKPHPIGETRWIWPTGTTAAVSAICQACGRQVRRAIVDGHRFCPKCGRHVIGQEDAKGVRYE